MLWPYQFNEIEEHVYLNRFLQYKTRVHHYVLFTQPTLLQGGGMASEQQSRLDLPSPGKESNSYSNNKFPGRSVEGMDQRSEVGRSTGHCLTV